MSTVKRHENDHLVETFRTIEHDLRMATFPELVEVTVEDDGETYKSLRCPRCRYLVDGELFAVDASIRTNEVGALYEENMIHGRVDIHGDDTDYGDTLYFLHGDDPGHPVALPDGWGADWA